MKNVILALAVLASASFAMAGDGDGSSQETTPTYYDHVWPVFATTDCSAVQNSCPEHAVAVAMYNWKFERVCACEMQQPSVGDTVGYQVPPTTIGGVYTPGPQRPVVNLYPPNQNEGANN